jgi:hypothetical protein
VFQEIHIYPLNSDILSSLSGGLLFLPRCFAKYFDKSFAFPFACLKNLEKIRKKLAA